MRAVAIMATAMTIAQAAPAQQLSSRLMDALTDCRAVADPKARLACFDRATSAMVAARSTGEVLVVDRAKVVERKRERFGLATGSGDAFGGGAEDRATAVTRLDTTIAAARQVPGGRWNMELADGSVWQTTEPVRRPPTKGVKIVVNRASLGGYRAAICGNRPILVKRLR
jgi:hypothetical protein